jgi:aminopeptidase N
MRSARLGALALSAGFLLLAACSDDTTDPKASGTTGPGTGGSGATGGEGGAGPTGPIDGEVLRYDFAFDLTTLQAQSTLLVDVVEPGGDCWAVSCGLPVSDVSVDAAPATTGLVADDVLTACGPGAGPGQRSFGAKAVIPEQTFLGLDVGFSRQTDLSGGTFSYLLSWVGGCDRFGPCDDDPSKLVELGFEVTHGRGDTVLCPGVRTAGATKTTCEISGTLAPTYSGFSIASDPAWVETPFISAAGVDVVFYEVPGGPLRAALDAASVSAFLEWITDLLGPFPYGSELRVAGAPTAWFGFEHPASIVLREDLPAYDGGAYADTTMHVLMHEIVHQWSGDRTTLASAGDFVWKEAIAEYLSYVFEDEQRPVGEAAMSLAYWDEIALGATYHPRPTDMPAPEVQEFYGDVYGPGPMVLFVQLESMFGRAAVLDAIAAFLADPVARSVEDLRDALEASSGQQLDAYFDAWVFGEGTPVWPTFQIAAVETAGAVDVTVTQMGKLHGCVVEVEVVGQGQTEIATIDFGPDPTQAAKTVTIPFSQQVMGLTLDPRNRLVGYDAMTAAADRARPRRQPMIF